MNKLSVNVGNKLIEIDYGTTLESLSKNYQSLFKYEIIVAKVDGIYKELTETITKNCEIEFFDLMNRGANQIYLNGLIYMTIYTFKHLFGKSANLKVNHSLDKGIYIESTIKITEEDIKKLADAQGKSVDQIKAIISSLHEFNPMMGHRGCRLAVTYPEIAKMQTSAVIRAAINVKKAHPDWNVKPEIMIPLVGDIKELKYVKKFVVETADAEIAAAGSDLEYEVGTMIEIPRAALTADEIAKEADFFCFGTNDLTQMTYGFSRDDAGKFLNAYYDAKIFENDPFAKLDQDGVGKLMKMAIDLGRPVNSSLHVGICGEHGGDPSSVEFCNKLGLDYVSCSPFRVPIARLAAAQAAIAQKNA